MKNKLLILISVLIAIAVVSGCVRKIPKPVTNNNTHLVNQNVNINTNTNTLDQNEDEEIDTSDWLTYRNEEYGFEVKYPEGWIYVKYDTEILFGTPESVPGGYIWGISIYQSDEIEKIIAQNGSQFYDRKESRSDITINKKIKGIIVTITTDKYQDWISKTVYFENNGQLFAIGNGAVEDKRFKNFYNSFEFID